MEVLKENVSRFDEEYTSDVETTSYVYHELMTSNSIGNISNTTEATVLGRNEDLAKIEITVQSLILALAIFGNGTVLLVLGTRKKKLSRMNMMIVHLSLADLFVAFFNVLPQLIWDITFRFYGNDFLCRSVKYFQVVAMYASSYVLVTTAIDRYLAICHPLLAQTWSSAKMHFLVLAAWILSLVFGLPQLIIFAYREVSYGSGVYDCWGVFEPEWTLQLYISWITLAIYIVPFCILVIAYGRICFVVWQSMMAREPSTSRKLYYRCSDKVENGVLLKDGATSVKNPTKPCGNSNPRAHTKGVSKAKVKTVKLTMTVIICYLLCWGPFFISQMWAAWDPNAPFTGKINFD